MSRHGGDAAERRRLLPNAPPPPYHHVNPPSGANAGYLPIYEPETTKRSASSYKKLILAIGSLAMFIFLCIQVWKHSNCVSIPDPVERARIVLEWQKERDAFAVESHDWEVQRMAWTKDERHHRVELRQWQSERVQREFALKQWEELERSKFEVEKGKERRAFQVEMERARNQFEDEKRGWDERRKEWVEDDRKHREELGRWASERRQYEDEKRRRAVERAREMGRMWGTPQGDECRAYDLRQYSVKLDAHAICKIAPITVKDHTVMAETCEVQNGQVVGRYKASGDPFCQFQWNGMHDKQCTTRGQTSGTRTFEARLGGLHRDRREYWQEMCNTTPASIHGLYFSKPTRCIQDKDGMSGEFDFDDPTCTWEDLRLNLKENSRM